MLLKAVEEKRFLPYGSDKEVTSDFQLIAGTHRDLREGVREGRFRELSASVARMATMADAGRIAEAVVLEEVARLHHSRGVGPASDAAAELPGSGADALGMFDRVQLNTVLRVCAWTSSRSAASRQLFAVARAAADGERCESLAQAPGAI